ncbi:cation transporter [Candidatus Micrarchaeota archaeon]|nr:cation transporter [Candidatus Micrarchaeota archaeon]
MTQRLTAAKGSIAVNAALLALKAGVSIATGSIGLLAETLHSGLDLVASTLAYVGIKKAMEPADDNHPYGHYRFENLSALAQVILIGLTALFVFWETAQHLLKPEPIQQAPLGIAVLLVSLACAWATAKWLDKVAKVEHSAALESDAYHFTTDTYASIAVLIGIAASMAGFPMADPMAAIAVGVVMLHGSVKLAKKSLLVLTDSVPDSDCLRQIQKLLKKDARVTSFHKLRARQSGARVFVDLHMRLAPRTSLDAAHLISHEVKAAIIKALPEVEDVHIHLEPEPKAETRMKKTRAEGKTKMEKAAGKKKK